MGAIGEHWVTTERKSMPATQLISALRAVGQTLATAESLTGGLLGATLVSVPGASSVYRGGVISYQSDMKTIIAGVPAETLAGYGAVSAETAKAMAAGIREISGSDYGLATTGVAGPNPQDGHEVGEVWIGLATRTGVSATRFQFVGNRQEIREQSVAAALRLLQVALTAP